VISSDIDYWKEIVEGNECGLCVNPKNPQEIAKAIEYIQHPKEASKMGENGKQAVLKKYNWRNEEEKLLYFYKKLLRS